MLPPLQICRMLHAHGLEEGCDRIENQGKKFPPNLPDFGILKCEVHQDIKLILVYSRIN